jgi:hypothetical protein
MQLSKIYDQIYKIFSKEGVSVRNGLARIILPSQYETKIDIFKDGIKISFPKEKPSLKIRLLPSFDLEAIHLNSTGGVIEVNNFPDIPFSYEEIEKILLDMQD